MSAVAYAGWMAALCAGGGASCAAGAAVAPRGAGGRRGARAARAAVRGAARAARARRSGARGGGRPGAAAGGARARGSRGGGARARAAAARSELVDVGALLDDGARGVAAAGARRSARRWRSSRCAGRALVRADPVRLAQACGNLVANAIEHGASPVRVRGRVLAGRVRMEVSDAGPGLPAPVRELVGRRGRRGGPRGRGLAIAARIAARERRPAVRGAERARGLPRARAPERGRRPVAGAVPLQRSASGSMTRRRRGALLIGLSLALGGLAASDVGRREAAVRAQLAPLVDVVVAGRDVRRAPPAAARPTSRSAASPRATRRSAPRLCRRRCSGAARWRRSRAARTSGPASSRTSPRRARRIRRGERAVEVAGAGSPQLVVAGAQVDVVVVPERGAARLALSGAEVLAARPLAAADAADGAARVAATLRVTAAPGAHARLARGRRPRGATARADRLSGGEFCRPPPSRAP